jgi:hypothetical protein
VKPNEKNEISLSFSERRQMRLEELLTELGAPAPWTHEWLKWSRENASKVTNAYNEAEKWAEENTNVRKRLQP